MEENKQMTPREFWASVKMMAEANIAEIESLNHRKTDAQDLHQGAMSSLAELLSECAPHGPLAMFQNLNKWMNQDGLMLSIRAITEDNSGTNGEH